MIPFVVGMLLTTQLFSQPIQKTLLSISDPYKLYLNDKASDSLFYYDLTPKNANGTVLILLSGFFRDAQGVFDLTSLPNEAANNHIITLVPSINSRIHSDTNAFYLINDMLLDYSKRTDMEVKKVIVGGLSAGGIMSLAYSIWMNQNPHEQLPSPVATFTVDSPVDLYNFWYIEKRLAERKCSQSATEEAEYVLQYLKTHLGGTPDQAPEAYKKASPYFRNAPDGGNIRYLKKTDVRAYCEPDIHFHMNKCEDYHDMNAADLSSMINHLKMSGNAKAELITTTNKGYRGNGAKHPHSWSILDAKECVKWIKRVTNSQDRQAR